MASTFDGRRADERDLRNKVLTAIESAGAASIRYLAEVMPNQAASEIERCVALLAEAGFVACYKGQHEPLYSSVSPCPSVLFGPVGDTGGGTPAALRPVGVEDLHELLGAPSWRYEAGEATLEGFARGTGDLTSAEVAAWRSVAERGAEALSVTRVPVDAPEQVRRLAALCGERPDAAEMLDVALRDWAGFDAVSDADVAQERLVASLPDARTVVSAGPGAGKTHAIRDRIVHLLEGGLPAPAVTVIAYSRAAVAELQARIPAFDGETVDIRTLDSVAGSIVSAATEDIGETDFDRTIRQASALFGREDRSTSYWLSSRRHVVVDEAQDVVGARRALLLALLGRLPEECGVTVLGDPAQAIYDYRARQEGQAALSLHDVLASKGFEIESLVRNHRSLRPSLKGLAAEGRKVVLNASGHAALAGMRELIVAASDGAPPGPAETRPVAALALFRSRSEAACHAARMGDAGLRVALPIGSPDEDGADMVAAPAWVGRAIKVLHGRGPSALAEAVAADPTAPSEVEARRVLAVALEGARYDAARMAQAMREGRAPLLERRAAQIASTIHAAKGREAEDVELRLPSLRDGLSDEEAAEEARVLYVAATRARRHLYVAPGARRMSTVHGRHWRRRGAGAQVQVLATDAAGMTEVVDGEGPIRHPLLRWCEGAWGLYADGPAGEVRLAKLGRDFARDVSVICAKLGERPFVPVARGRLWAGWATLARGDTLGLAPIVEGFVWINLVRS